MSLGRLLGLSRNWAAADASRASITTEPLLERRSLDSDLFARLFNPGGSPWLAPSAIGAAGALELGCGGAEAGSGGAGGMAAREITVFPSAAGCPGLLTSSRISN